VLARSCARGSGRDRCRDNSERRQANAHRESRRSVPIEILNHSRATADEGLDS
jgi:hypothetical protein